jgi:16S rRNA (guanine(966)-N(2))-methyltransferase RsmD
MRIVAGKFKSRRLKQFKGSAVRPTSDRVKEAMFRILGARVIDADFLDLCAGTGSIGLEALSRGAKSATFIDSNHHRIGIIESNLELCGFYRKHPQVQLLNLDARRALARLGRRKAVFDLIYFDPPYVSGIHKSCLAQIVEVRLLSPTGLLVMEHRKVKKANDPMPAMLGELALNRQEHYGDTVLSFYVWEGAENAKSCA